MFSFECLWYSGQIIKLLFKLVSSSRPPDAPECCQTRCVARTRPSTSSCADVLIYARTPSKSNCCVLHQQTFPPQFPLLSVSHSHTHTHHGVMWSIHCSPSGMQLHSDYTTRGYTHTLTLWSPSPLLSSAGKV